MNRSREFAEQLLQKARDDQHVLDRLADDPDAAVWTIGFHAQQAVEKALKAVLSASGMEYPRTHNLTLLLGLLKATQPPDAGELHRLTPYGVLLRYDTPTTDESEALFDRAWAAGCVRRTIDWADSVLRESKGKAL
jgi:HEPN domain-containing protein